MENLKSYLITRLLMMLAPVLVFESAALFIVRRVALPFAAAAARFDGDVSSLRVGDTVRMLFSAVLGRGESVMLDFLSRSTAAVLLLLGFLLLLLPPAFGILWYANLVAKKVDALEKEREKERAAYDRQRNLMFSDFAHDLRTPVMTISGYAGALADGMVTEEGKKQEYLEAIRTKADRMGALISSLFEYTKLGSVNFALNKEMLDLNELLREVTASCYPEIEDAGMDLLVEIPDEPYRVMADGLQLSRVITNLVINAVRHNPEGTKIAVSVKQLAGLELIAVADTGVVIDKDPEQLFAPFVKGDDARSGGNGSGLGLAIASKVAEMHGFTLELRQPFGRYTKAFILSVPERISAAG